MNDFNNFFERATALRDAIKKNTVGALKDVRLDILGQIVGLFFISGEIPYNITIQSYCIDAPHITLEILKKLQIEATITHKTYRPTAYQITEVNAYVSEVNK